jgi:membrane protease YdiL (CAAX protease family)
VSGSLQSAARSYLRGLADESTVVLCGGAALLILSRHHGSADFFRRVFWPKVAGHPAFDALPYFWWFGTSVIFYAVLPLLLSALTRGSFNRSYGLGLGDFRAGAAIASVFLLFMAATIFITSRTSTFANHYPLAGPGAYTLRLPDSQAVSRGLFALYEASYFLYFLAWEFFFRGWMLNALLPRFGRGAIAIQTVPFALMHMGKPELEGLGSIIAGVALGILALRTRSFWYGAFLHGALAVFMDLLVSWRYLFPHVPSP